MANMLSSAVKRPITRTGIVVLLMMAALAVRLHEIEQPLVTFRAIRHYRSAMIARDFYYHATSGITPQAVAVADANRSMQQAGEPPIMEWLAVALYLVTGGEHVAIPRTLAALAWVAGAIPLWCLAMRFGPAGSALVACAFYLFLPFGIVASRNFQPDALMTCASLWALLALVRQHEEPGTGRSRAAIGLVALALLIKPMSVFLVLPVAIGLHLTRRGARSYLTLAGFLAASMLPAALYYGSDALFGNLVKDQMRMRFVPHLLLSKFFWHGWMIQIQRVFTWPVFLLGLLGVWLAPRVGRAMLASMWLGYMAFAIAFTYHMPTHDYYHWPFLAAVALGAGAAAGRLERMLALRVSPRVAGIAVAAGVLAIAAIGTAAAWPRLHVRGAEAQLAAYRDIGSLTAHHTRVLFLDLEYGYPLMYHGELSGDAWPNQDDLAAEALGGRALLTARARFERDYADFDPRYFVVTDLESLDAQPDLQTLLAERAVVVRRAAGYSVYRFTSAKP
jgi:hypothetical protein